MFSSLAFPQVSAEVQQRHVNSVFGISGSHALAELRRGLGLLGPRCLCHVRGPGRIWALHETSLWSWLKAACSHEKCFNCSLLRVKPQILAGKTASCQQLPRSFRTIGFGASFVPGMGMATASAGRPDPVQHNNELHHGCGLSSARSHVAPQLTSLKPKQQRAELRQFVRGRPGCSGLLLDPEAVGAARNTRQGFTGVPVLRNLAASRL